MFVCEQALAFEVTATVFQKSKARRLRQSAIFGVVSDSEWYDRFSRMNFTHPRKKILDVHSVGDSSDDHTKGGELWVTFIPQTLHRFKAVNYITSLTLDHFPVTPLNFPILQRTFWDLTSSVKNLRLLCPSACPVSLLQFIAIFRDLRSATIHAPSWVKEDQCEDGKATPFGQFHGELCLSELDDASIPFISFLGSFAAGASKVTISKCNLRDPRSFQAFLSSAKRTIQSLQVIVSEEGEQVQSSSLSHF